MLKLYSPPKNSHKGQNGKLFVIGGSKKYHGAPIFSLLAARRFVDLLYFYPAEADPYLISAVKNIPEVIVVNDFEKLAECDCVLFGIGLSDAKFDIARLRNAKKLVIDGDGLKLIKGNIPKNSILTPHEGEFKFLFGADGTKRNVQDAAKKNNCIILKKGPIDIISDGSKLKTNKTHNQGMTKGGTGDVLSGLVAALCCKNSSFNAAVAAAKVNGNAGNMLMKKYGYNFSASDLAEMLAESLSHLYTKEGNEK
ncbi:NAD(P)H-hydrate dehydratase [Candidatus Micrarchaeota archaeon]|nr:NAD(P)H-hydrate dehydratase [Candidatus Micrarchaeota archaeon]